MIRLYCVLFYCLVLARYALGAADVYYSVCPYGTGDIKTGSPNITITSGIATLTVAQTGNIGIGCCIEYNSLRAFISTVNSSTSFDVVTAVGATAPDQTSTAVTSIHHEYASLSAFEAGFTDSNHINNGSLPGADVRANACCYYDHDDDTPDSTELTVNFGTTDSTRYLRIYTPTTSAQAINDQRHDGKWTTGDAYRMEVSNYNILSLAEPYTEVTGLQIKRTGGATTYNGIVEVAANGAYNLLVEKCILQDAAGGCGIYWKHGNSGGVVRNCIVYCTTSLTTDTEGIWSQSSDTLDVFNSTVHTFDIGIGQNSGTMVATNCASFGNNDDFSGTITISYCASDDGDGSNPQTPADWTAVFVDYSTGDFHLKSTDTDLQDNGTDLESAEGFNDDIEDDTRPGGSGWDIGADEYPAAPPAGQPYYMRIPRQQPHPFGRRHYR